MYKHFLSRKEQKGNLQRIFPLLSPSKMGIDLLYSLSEIFLLSFFRTPAPFSQEVWKLGSFDRAVKTPQKLADLFNQVFYSVIIWLKVTEPYGKI